MSVCIPFRMPQASGTRGVGAGENPTSTSAADRRRAAQSAGLLALGDLHLAMEGEDAGRGSGGRDGRAGDEEEGDPGGGAGAVPGSREEGRDPLGYGSGGRGGGEVGAG